MTVVMVLVGGGLGAVARYLIDLAVRSRHDSAFPWGTLVVNVLGSLVVGVTAGAAVALALPTWVLALVATGFCGALTTFSTFGYETVRLLQEGSVLIAGLNCVLSLALGLGACAGGFWAASALLQSVA